MDLNRRNYLRTGASASNGPGRLKKYRFNGCDGGLRYGRGDPFGAPPAATKPHTWRQWMNDRVTSEGITRDLEAIADSGPGEVHLFAISDRTPPGPVVNYSPDWLDLKNHALSEAHRLGLDLTLHDCSGWSSNREPGVTPALSMQQLVRSETLVTSGQAGDVHLPRPPANKNYYQGASALTFASVPGETLPPAQPSKPRSTGQ
ncbi:glycosyl hydrolase [Streptomyces sp. CA-106131]|uniref:glycosyl hydrolase n=1 Tax=Streptomyces sp. CA-106131 TaxID=3240045 RepID=UPI003D92908E